MERIEGERRKMWEFGENLTILTVCYLLEDGFYIVVFALAVWYFNLLGGILICCMLTDCGILTVIFLQDNFCEINFHLIGLFQIILLH